MPALTCLLEPPPTEAERPPRRLACTSFSEADGAFTTMDEWTALWERTRGSPRAKKRIDVLTHGITGLRYWLGDVRLPLLVPVTREAFEGSGFMRWYGAIVDGIMDLPPSQGREDVALYLEKDVLPLLMRIDPLKDRRDSWRAALGELSAMRNNRI